ncbi:MAG: choloylglycine hydrolase [Prevotella sp.]|nr:choloylglycine hydrolase [Prevotella sp.]
MNKIGVYSKVLKRIVFTIMVILLLTVLIPVTVGIYYFNKADFKCPNDSIYPEKYHVKSVGDSIKYIEHDLLHRNKYGLWEVYISGSPLERGTKYGVLTKDLLQYQENVFVEQIKEIIPSDFYFSFLHKLIAIFNWDMASYIPEEYRKEIYAISQSCSHEFDSFGTPYERQLNYHAAHDIGHTMQEYMLVGCSSFAAWNENTSDSTLLIGRNFDFYVNDKFARNKIILFMEPEKGYKFVSVSWPGMMGVVSGMNEKGLTITINAAKGAIPVTSAMPISLLVREILQNAKTIQEAYQIAQVHKTFVSESILIGSAIDRSAAIIEKTPSKTSLYKETDNEIICTNHFQSNDFMNDSYNIENINNSDSKYRYDRLSELIKESIPLSPDKVATILRDRRGLNNKDIGLTNQKSINQSISHHSVIFKPEELKIWVSTEPWQSGTFLCYNLKEIFDNPNKLVERNDKQLTIPADTLFLENDYQNILDYRKQFKKIRESINSGLAIPIQEIHSFIELNPNYYEVYNIIGDYYNEMNDIRKAVEYWKKSLDCEIPSVYESNKIRNKIKEYDKE